MRRRAWSTGIPLSMQTRHAGWGPAANGDIRCRTAQLRADDGHQASPLARHGHDALEICTPIRARSSIAASEAEQMAASDHVPILFKNRLQLAARPQMRTTL